MSEHAGRIPQDATNAIHRNFVMMWGNPEILQAPILWRGALYSPASAVVLMAKALKKEGYATRVRPLNQEITQLPMTGIYVDEGAKHIMEKLATTHKFMSLIYVTDDRLNLDPEFGKIMQLAGWGEASGRRLCARRLERQADFFMDIAQQTANIHIPGIPMRPEEILRRQALQWSDASITILGDLERLSDAAMPAFVHAFVKDQLRRPI